MELHKISLVRPAFAHDKDVFMDCSGLVVGQAV